VGAGGAAVEAEEGVEGVEAGAAAVEVGAGATGEETRKISLTKESPPHFLKDIKSWKSPSTKGTDTIT